MLLDMVGTPWPVMFLAMAGKRIISPGMIAAVEA
jgi:hypothetical protein